MELRPSKGLKVMVNAQREAVFGDEAVSVQAIKIHDGARAGVMTGQILAGFCEVEMQGLDGRKHWFPIGDLSGENGEKIVEEEIALELEEDETQEPEEEPA